MNIENNKVTLYLMRHGETIINKAGRVQGWCDGVLTENGIKVANSVALGLSNIAFTAVYSSDLRRAVKTADIIIKNNKINNNLVINEIENLREINFGKYEGELEKLMFKDIFTYLNLNSFEDALKLPNFGRAFVDACATLDETSAAENFETLITRVIDGLTFVAKDVQSSGGGNALVVLHGGILRHILSYIDENLNIKNIENSSISLIEYIDNEFKVVSVNDMSYYTN